MPLACSFTPYEVAYLEAPSTWEEAGSDVSFLLNRIVDLLFVADLAMQFVLMYQLESGLDGVKWIDEPKQIVYTYLKGWFAIDFFSTLPSLADIVPLFLASEGGDSNLASRFKAVRVIRCARLAKLMRLLRASRMFKRWETRISINYSLLSLCKALVFYFLLAHWSACLLVLPSTFYDSRADTFLGVYGFCSHEASGGDGGGGQGGGGQGDGGKGGCAPALVIYVAMLSHSLQLICGAAGGALDAGELNTQEQLVYAVVCVAGALL